MTIQRLNGRFDRWDALLDLILAAFAYMNGRIDPPSSALALTPEALREKAMNEIAYVAFDGDQLAGCIFCRPETECLYVGKLAVLPAAQGKGIGRRLLTYAEAAARQHDLHILRLETRIELIDNHATFAAWGFQKVAENRHPGFDRTTSIEMRKAVI
ncbi:GNAT family N-acetyltransferase [Rhizobium sp. P28RR-XV]|uniref:GNAT family N-acetyltransferase n=1 Tax=Rhizobium sp. P28RR-XV TaxID=2726737 RepID=UPI0028AE948A|nr:GNAT family N-acetyltransferase [Rhizobium sp. P28RR-XV]